MRHAVYGDLSERDSIALVTALAAKGIDYELVAQTPALSLSLAMRAGREEGPYLRTPEGFVMGDLATTLDYLERIQPEPAWRPISPVRRICARLLEDWIELWLPVWPERSPAVLEGLSVHLAASGFLLGSSPSRPDGSLAAWLEADALVDPAVQAQGATFASQLREYARNVRRTAIRPFADDAIPISLLPLLAELAQDYHVYLMANREAVYEGDERVEVDLGFGRTVLPAWTRCEERRGAIAQELAGFPVEERRAVRQMLEPVGAWHALTLPAVATELAAGDPRSLET